VDAAMHLAPAMIVSTKNVALNLLSVASKGVLEMPIDGAIVTSFPTGGIMLLAISLIKMRFP
jgi:hypothetical protein